MDALNRTETEIRTAVAAARSKTDAIYKLGYSPKTASVRLKLNLAITEYNIDISHFDNMRIDWNQLADVTKHSTNISEILRGMGLFNRGNNYQTVQNQWAKQSIDFSHIRLGYIPPPINSQRKPDNEVFCVDSTAQRSTVRSRVIKERLIEYKCAGCQNNGTWRGKDITLQLEHKNGASNDHSLNNLEFLCPNCHSQTATWGRKTRIA
jgi:Zn finger protein HypA/HybF involved in hydrogenase expression